MNAHFEAVKKRIEDETRPFLRPVGWLEDFDLSVLVIVADGPLSGWVLRLERLYARPIVASSA